METPPSSLELLFEKVEAYGKTTYELTKLKTLEATIEVISTLIARLSVIILIALFAVVFTIGIALLLGELLGKAYYGFFIVAAFYLIAAIILHSFLHRWIKKPITGLIIPQTIE